MTATGPNGRPRRRWLGLTDIPLFARCVVVGAVLAVGGGATFGFVRGLDYLPTLPFAVVEGAILIGVPGSIVATVLAGLIAAGRRLSARDTHSR